MCDFFVQTFLQVDNGVSPEVVRSVLAERGNDPCLAARTAYKVIELKYDPNSRLDIGLGDN